MTRALLTLAVGIVLAVLLAAVIAGARDLSAVLGPVLITTAVGTVVFGVVAARARFRRRLEELEDGSPTPTTPQETDRG